MNKAIIPRTAIIRNGMRQLMKVLIEVPNGAPRAVAIVNPEKIKAIALACLDGPTSSAAMIELRAKSRPCAAPATKRPINTVVKLGAKAINK